MTNTVVKAEKCSLKGNGGDKKNKSDAPALPRRQWCNTCFQKHVILFPISTHLQPKKPYLPVAQVGQGVLLLLVFPLEASWQQSWCFRASDIIGVGRWLWALPVGWALTGVSQVGDGGPVRSLTP